VTEIDVTEIDVEIDALTESVVDQRSARVLSTRIFAFHELKQHSPTAHWRFDWGNEASATGRDVFGLVVDDGDVIEGLISFERAEDHVFVHLVEIAPHNVGENTVFRGVPGNLFAYVCLRSFEYGFSGFVAFDAKTELILHYQHSLGARQIGSSSRMIIDAERARQLITQYFKEFDEWPS